MTPLFPPEALTSEGLQKFLAGTYIKGIGPAYAGRLVERFGESILKPGFDFAKIPAQVTGLGESKVEELRKCLETLRFPPEAAVLLYSAGLSDIEVEKILSHYGRKAAEALTEDPYDMVENAWKVSFFTADKLGKWLGVPPDDPRRIRGALLSAVKFYAERGHMFATEQQAVKTASALTGAPEELVRPQLGVLEDEGRLIASRGGVYLPVYYEAEKEAAMKILRLIRRDRPVAEDFEVPEYDIGGHRLNESQRRAILAVMTNPVTVITGGPGTGKTTAIRGIISLFEGMGKKAVLAAPTGRAAKRMADLSGGESKTLHRLLGYTRGRGYRNKKMDADILVIDEASMLEQVMFRHVLDALDDDTKVVLVGDTHQLPAIGAGDVLADVIKSGAVPVVELDENFRHKAGSGIAGVAEAVKNRGALENDPDGEDFEVYYEEDAHKILKRLLTLVGRDIPDRFGIDPRDIQVVTPQQDGMLGARELNVSIREAVNPSGPELRHGLKLFRLGDRVMQTSNSSEHDVFNGETGWVSGVDAEGGRIEVTFFDGKRQWYGKTRLKELTLAYATTVHKLQGSETDYMVLVMSSDHHRLLYRNLLYTGISRARRLCVLVGERKAVVTALSNDSPTIRNSNFKYRLSHPS